MTRRELKQLVDKANKLYGRAVKSGLSSSDYYNSLEQKIDVYIGRPVSKNKLINITDVPSSKLNLVGRTLNSFVKSDYATKAGVKRIQEKRIATLMENWKISRKQAIRLNKMMTSDEVKEALATLEYVSYRDMLDIARNYDNLTPKKLMAAIDDVDKYFEKFKKDSEENGLEFNEPSSKEKADVLLKLLTGKLKKAKKVS